MTRLPPAAAMLLATLCFALMSVAVKFASQRYGTGEVVFYRGLIGMLAMAALLRAQGGSWRTPVPGMHVWRSASGVTALSMWFISIGGLPLATAITLNYMSSVWMALFLIGGAVLMGGRRVDGRLVACVLLGFGGVALILQPTLEREQLGHGLVGLASGLLSALAYLQVTALGRAGEPEARVVFYFSMGSVLVGLGLTTLGPLLGLRGGWTTAHTPFGLACLLAVGGFATLAQWLMTRAYASGSTLVNASLHYLGIVYAAVFGQLFFDDRLNATALAGMALVIVAGLGATLLRSRAAPDAAADPGEA